MKDNLTCKVFADRGEMGKFAAKSVADKMHEFLAERPEINMVFAAAPSQNEILKYLAEEKLNWSRVKAFYMDEYVGLEGALPKRLRTIRTKALFRKVKLKKVCYIGSGGFRG